MRKTGDRWDWKRVTQKKTETKGSWPKLIAERCSSERLNIAAVGRANDYLFCLDPVSKFTGTQLLLANHTVDAPSLAESVHRKAPLHAESPCS